MSGGLTFGGGYFGQYAMGGTPPAPPSGPVASTYVDAVFTASVVVDAVAIFQVNVDATSIMSVDVAGIVE